MDPRLSPTARRAKHRLHPHALDAPSHGHRARAAQRARRADVNGCATKRAPEEIPKGEGNRKEEAEDKAREDAGVRTLHARLQAKQGR